MITTSDIPQPKDSYEMSSKFRVNIDAIMQINRYTENGKDVFYHCYEFLCAQNEYTFTVNIRINYTELDANAASYILSTSTPLLRENPFVHPSNTNGSKTILILGNSFISTSQIGSFLNDMLVSSKSEYDVNAVSIGMASVKTFAEDAEICNLIAQGNYCYVFICGFYSESAVSQLNTIKDVCTVSGTPLVIFPAHNETQTTIDSAVVTHNELCFLDWKGEIDSLIESGISYDDFCVNDYHKHSKPLAGYVGAHMIYRSLFGNPPKLTANAPLPNEYVNSKLGEYIANGWKTTGVNIYALD